LASTSSHASKKIGSVGQEIWDRYSDALSDLPLILPAPIEKGDRHAYHLYTVLVDTDKTKISRDQFLNEMTKRNIGTGVHFRALHLQPFYREHFGYKEGELPNSEWVGERTVSIPLSPKLTDEDVTDVIEAISDIFG
jgi:dTDP-4-amino-4,6-dideoxygalactose transaminase